MKATRWTALCVVTVCFWTNFKPPPNVPLRLYLAAGTVPLVKLEPTKLFSSAGVKVWYPKCAIAVDPLPVKESTFTNLSAVILVAGKTSV